MAENLANKNQDGTTSEKPGQDESSWLTWINKTSKAMNKKFRRTNPDFLKNLKKSNKSKP